MYLKSDIFNKYEYLLPSKYDGGYLIVALYHKIKSEEIDEYFSKKDIDTILKEISDEFNKGVADWSRLRDILFNYYLRSLPDDPSKYYLTDFAKSLIDLIQNKLSNPYKDFPLKQTIDKKFNIKNNQINSINDLEIQFGREFIQGEKKVITDHLDSLETELLESYKILNEILLNEESNATILVKKFTIEFNKFGTRAEDIREAIASKDKFLRDLQNVVDTFFRKVEDNSLNASNKELRIYEWHKSQNIYNDLLAFFNYVESKLEIIKKQINNASDKLSELQEYFSVRANLKLKVKKLLQFALSDVLIENNTIYFKSFPLKGLVYEIVNLVYPVHYEFLNTRVYTMINIDNDIEYEKNEKLKISEVVKKQQIVNKWVKNIFEKLNNGESINLKDTIEKIASKENDSDIPYLVVSNVIGIVNENKEVHININCEIAEPNNNNLILWKTTIHK